MDDCTVVERIDYPLDDVCYIIACTRLTHADLCHALVVQLLHYNVHI